MNSTVKIVNNGINDFKYADDGSSGFDIRANHDAIVYPNDVKLIKTGFFVEMPKGIELQVRSRSGLALKKKITVLNSPGTVDSSYRGEIGVILKNDSSEPFEIFRGDRIAQGVFAKVEYPCLIVTTEPLSQSERGEGGFGHTGIN